MAAIHVVDDGGLVGVETISVREWVERGRRIYGEPVTDWRFRCPACGNVTSPRDWIEAGVLSEGDPTSECIGVYIGGIKPFTGKQFEEGRPCQYRANGRTRLSDLRVVQSHGRVMETFRFADEACEYGIVGRPGAADDGGEGA